MDSGSVCVPKAAAACFGLAAARGANGLPSERRFGFPASARLKRRADYQLLYRHGVKAAGRYVVIFVLPGRGRFGVTASRRVGAAVRRSRCKRRLRELYRLHRETIPAGCWDMVANAKPGCATIPWVDLERDFLTAVQRATGRAMAARPPQSH
jgi:ribonuclease P protein component